MTEQIESPQQLLPCPFCGSDDIRLTGGMPLAFRDTYWYSCGACGCAGPFKRVPENARTAWNGRTAHSEQTLKLINANVKFIQKLHAENKRLRQQLEGHDDDRAEPETSRPV